MEALLEDTPEAPPEARDTAFRLRVEPKHV